MKKNATVMGTLLLAVATGVRAQQKPTNGIVQGGSAEVRAEVSFTPVLSIQLGSGATNKNGEGTDVVRLDLKTVKDYTKSPGVSRRINKHLAVFSVGSGYSVGATLKASNDNIYKIFRFGLGATEYFTLYPASPTMNDLFTGVSEDAKELDASYAMSTVTAENAKIFNELVGKEGTPKTYSVDITYTIAPN